MRCIQANSGPSSNRSRGRRMEKSFKGLESEPFKHLLVVDMETRTMRRIIAVFIVMLFLVLAAPTAMPAKRGWVPLFDGKDLSGWKINGDEKWAVEQGTIVGESTANKYGYLTSEKTYRDF